MNCPICDKTGLEVHAPTCPQCNCDLSAFHLLQATADHYQALETDAKQTQQQQKRNYGCLGFAGLGLLTGICYLIWQNHRQDNQYQQLVANKQQLEYSLTAVKPMIAVKPPDSRATAVPNALYQHPYIVRKGDYLAKIATFFYNDHHAYKQIIMDNQLRSSVLHIGDTLIINLKPHD